MPEANSNRVAPKLKISAFLVMRSVTFKLLFKSSGAMYTESPSTSSSLFVRLQTSTAYPKSPSFTIPSAITKKFDGFMSR